MKQAGIVYATEQIIDLMANGVNNIHIYTMNKPDVAHQIMEGFSPKRSIILLNLAGRDAFESSKLLLI